jgi:FAD dependent oxidoreductase TIGR03364
MFDVAVIGAGIVGLAHAYEAHRRGLSVIILERSARPGGASVRNFGMFWPIGHRGKAFARALRSRTVYDELATKAGFWLSPCGSFHACHHEDELALAKEFVSTTREHHVELLDAPTAAARFACLQPQTLKGGVFSATEAAIDPREVITKLTTWLAAQPGVTYRPSAAAREIDASRVILADGERIAARLAIVCTGADTEILYPNLLRRPELSPCKLQMMRTSPQPEGWRLGPHLSAGSTFRHYPTFKGLATLRAVADRFARERPHFDRYGIHVMCAQNQAGELIIGDSHIYDDAADPFSREDIDRWILDYLRTFLNAPHLDISSRWHGVYLKRTDGYLEFIHEPQPGVRIVNGIGGGGMTLAFGLAREHFDTIDAGRTWEPTPV